ncbi:MAG: hypothetical protein VYE09_00980 [Pseudomonadota bacterium]|nr:hypothetical protein [Pseudomonadota bacterium]
MQYKFVIVFLLIIYIFSGYITEDIKTPIENYSKTLQEEIYIDESEIKVFETDPVDSISVTENKVEAWIIEIEYNEQNVDEIKNLLLKNGYKLAINKSKMIYTIGPFANISHAKEESSKLTKVLGVDNKISSFIF